MDLFFDSFTSFCATPLPDQCSTFKEVIKKINIKNRKWLSEDCSVD